MSGAWTELLAAINGREPAALMPGVRDPNYPCEMFAPGVPSGTDCETDGHYLCRECVHAPPHRVTDDAVRALAGALRERMER